MKCIQQITNSKVLRVLDDHAEEMVRSGEYRYVTKSLWKEQRDAK